MRARADGARRRRKRRRAVWWFLLVLLLAGGAAGFRWWQKVQPSREYVQPAYMNRPAAVMFRGAWTREHAVGEGEGLKISLELARQLLGDGVWHEPETQSVVLTTPTDVLHLKPGKRNATLNRKPFELRFAAEQQGDTIYLPLAPLTGLFGLKAETGEGTGIVTLFLPGDAYQRGTVTKGKTALRNGPGRRHPILQDLAAGDTLRIWGEKDGWYAAQSAAGHIGYVDKRHVALEGVEQVPARDGADGSAGADYAYWNLTGRRINLTWDAVYSVPADPANLDRLQGVNVVSPTWFELMDGDGNIRSKADRRYVERAHANGMQVWALFSNSFDPDLTHEALATHEKRMHMIAQLLAFAQTFKLQGINIDFENVYLADKEKLVQFVRELTPLMHAQGLVVSIDVTPKSNNEMWSAFLDRKKLGQIVDFMMVMAYDEHWATSPKAGSVSSLPWAENAVKRILEEDGVPPEKLLLGIPLYTRIWTIDPEGKVSSKAVGMETVRGLIRERKLKPVLSEETGQHVVEYKEGGNTHKIWIEDEHSIRARAKLVKKYGLAGVASWQRGFAADDIWQVLDEELQRQP